MLLDLSQKFVSMDGKTIKDIRVFEEGNKKRRDVLDLTLERVVSLALAEPVDQKMSGDNKVKCFGLILKIMGNKQGTVDLVAEDVTFIKNLIKPKYSVVVVGEAMLMLEGRDIGIELLEELEPEPEPDIPEDDECKKEPEEPAVIKN